MDLYKLYLEIQGTMGDFSFGSVKEGFKFVPDLYAQIRKQYQGENYYRALATYVDMYKPNSVLELGTYQGASAAALSSAGAKVDTYDISISIDSYLQKFLNGRGTNFCILGFPDDVLMCRFEKYDFIFVDIDHSGIFEPKIHEAIKKSGYKGVVFYDDIDLNPAMREFWKSIELPKRSTDWHFSGFGMVYYGGEYGGQSDEAQGKESGDTKEAEVKVRKRTGKTFKKWASNPNRSSTGSNG